MSNIDRAISEIATWANQAAQIRTAALRGISDAQKGIVKLNTLDDGLLVSSKQGPPVIPTADDAARHKRELVKLVLQSHAAVAGYLSYMQMYERMGLEPYRDDAGNIVVVHPGRQPTADEKKIASSESIDEDWCKSCLRVGLAMVAGPKGMCSTCTKDLNICKALKPDTRLTMPPLPIMELRRDGKRVYDVDYQAALQPATKKKAKKA